jgi:hypothetical protein
MSLMRRPWRMVRVAQAARTVSRIVGRWRHLAHCPGTPVVPPVAPPPSRSVLIASANSVLGVRVVQLGARCSLHPPEQLGGKLPGPDVRQSPKQRRRARSLALEPVNATAARDRRRTRCDGSARTRTHAGHAELDGRSNAQVATRDATTRVPRSWRVRHRRRRVECETCSDRGRLPRRDPREVRHQRQ